MKGLAIGLALVTLATSGAGAQEDRHSGVTDCTIKAHAPRAITFQCRGDLYDGWAARGDGTGWFGYVFCTKRGQVKCFDNILMSIDMPRDLKLAQGSQMLCRQIADLMKCRYGENGWR